MKLGALVIGSCLTISGLTGGFAGHAENSANSDATGSYVIDSGHSSVVFRVTHLGAAPFYGRFNDIKGDFTFDAANPEKSTVNVMIDPASIDTNSKNRDGHLKSPDFLNVKQFPKLTFKSKSLKKSGDGWKLIGDLNLHGVTKEITADFEWVGTGEFRDQVKGGFGAEFTVKRSDFGMDYMQGPLSDEITIMVGVEGAKK